ncbi:amine oxidase family member 1-like [Anopheles stephensi]|uniref:amine oxidase family member 1-like n=1 Tax=Anopheles stephensi TaxID=30069 RepID=UPI001658B836|nr:amine oxidase family member 1-like [Anopheles stephensi]
MNPRIVIIGAGAAGVAAATRLIERGYKNVKILEAENRIGGRIHTVPFGANVVDLGAQWCHGEKGNVCYELGSKYNVFDSNSARYERFVLTRSNGEQIPKERSEKLLGLIWSILETHKHELTGYRGSLGSFIMGKFRALLETPEYADVNDETAYQVLEFFQKFENSIEASDSWFDTSGPGYLHYWECDGDLLLNWRDKGYRTVLEILMKRHPLATAAEAINLEDYTHFNKTVANINWTAGPDSLVSIRCTDSTVYDADHVICTMSLGVLKERYQTLFTPDLPPIKRNAIQGLTIGTVNKLFLEFDKPFWAKGWQGLSLIWNQADLDEVRQMPDSWMEDVFGFYIVDYQPNVLCGWISGKNARRMERASDEDVRRACMFLLRKFMKGCNIPEPVRFQRTSWYANPNFRGSYTFRSMTTDLLNTSASHLAIPLTNSCGMPVVQFAGEATHDHYYSTVHGAVETGWREANRLIDLYDRLIPPFNHGPKAYVDVLILGAGIAGLGAARQLRNSGKSFAILEAQSVPGGRISTKALKRHHVGGKGCQLVEAGAQWLHGRQNELHELAKRNGLLREETSEEGLGEFLRDDGFRIDDQLVKRVDFIVGQILEQCEEFATRSENDPTPYPVSLEAYLRDQFRKRTEKDFTAEQRVLAQQLLDWHCRFQIIDNSCLHVSDISAKLWGSYSFNGESCQAHINMRYGFQALVSCLIEEIGAEKIVYNKAICEIRWLDSRSKVIVKCTDGTIYCCQHLIVTFSLGVLKDTMDQLFQPNLPASYSRSIRSIGYGTIDKIFLQFEERWWGKAEGIQLVWRDELRKDSHWTRFISGFDVLSPGPPNTLLGWIGSYGALEMEALNDEQIVSDCVFILEKFTKKKVPKPVNYYCTRWNSNRYIRGSYSYTSVNCDHEQNFMSNLTETLVCNQYDKLGEESRKKECPSSISATPVAAGNRAGSAATSTSNTSGHSTSSSNSSNTLTSVPIANLSTSNTPSKVKSNQATTESLANTPSKCSSSASITVTPSGGSTKGAAQGSSCAGSSSAKTYATIHFAGEACHERYFSTVHGAYLSGMEQAKKIMMRDQH